MQDFLHPNLLLVFEMELPKMISVRDQRALILRSLESKARTGMHRASIGMLHTWRMAPVRTKKLLIRRVGFRPNFAAIGPLITAPTAPPIHHRPWVNEFAFLVKCMSQNLHISRSHTGYVRQEYFFIWLTFLIPNYNFQQTHRLFHKVFSKALPSHSLLNKPIHTGKRIQLSFQTQQRLN